MQELKPCPFCGSEPEQGRTAEMWDGSKGFPKFGIGCPDNKCLGAQTYCKFSSLEEAINAWNTRAPIDEAEINSCGIWCPNCDAHLKGPPKRESGGDV